MAMTGGFLPIEPLLGLPAPDAACRGLLLTARGIVYFDCRLWDLHDGDEAVVLRHDSSIGVERVQREPPHQTYAGSHRRRWVAPGRIGTTGNRCCASARSSATPATSSAMTEVPDKVVMAGTGKGFPSWCRPCELTSGRPPFAGVLRSPTWRQHKPPGRCSARPGGNRSQAARPHFGDKFYE